MDNKIIMDYLRYNKRVMMSFYSWGFVLMIIISLVLGYIMPILGILYSVYLLLNIWYMTVISKIYILEIIKIKQRIKLVYYNKDIGPNSKLCDISMLKLDLYEPTRGTLIPSSLIIKCDGFSLRQYGIGRYDKERLRYIYSWLKELKEK